MQDVHREIIQRNIIALSKEVNLDHLYPLLLEQNIIQDEDVRDFQTDQKSQTEDFFRWYCSREPKAFDVLIKSLRALDLENLATLLESGSEDVGAGNGSVMGGLSVSGPNGLNKNDDPSELQNICSMVREVEEASCKPLQSRYSLSKFLPFRLFKKKTKTNEVDATDSSQEEFQYVDIQVKDATLYNMLQTENVYPMQSKPRGYALIINNIRFPKKKQYRLGAEVDSVNLVGLLRKLGFEVTLGHNLTKKEFFELLEEFISKFSEKSVDACVVSIMSHGNDNVMKMCNTYRSEIRIWEDVIKKFNNVNCPALVGKPKIFFIQTCRGKDDDMGVSRTGAGGRNQASDSAKDAVLQIPRNINNKASFGDILLCYATIPGYTATRDFTTGTWYTRSLCEVFMSNAHDTEIKRLLDMVGIRMEQILSVDGNFQTPSYKSIGFNYSMYFNPGLYENNSKLPATRKRIQEAAASSSSEQP